MDWLFANWALAAGLGRQPGRQWHNYDDDFRTPGTLIGVRSRLSTVEMWLVRLTYKEIAAELRCEKCGAPLGRELRFIPPGDHDPSVVAPLSRDEVQRLEKAPSRGRRG